LNASEGIVKFLGGSRATFYLVDGFVEYFSNVEKADNVPVFVADGLKERDK
jgi:hypothetical protein